MPAQTSMRSDLTAPEAKTAKVTFNEQRIKEQAAEAEARRAARQDAGMTGSPKKGEPGAAGDATGSPKPKSGFWKRRKEKWKQRAAKKGKGKGKSGGSLEGAGVRQVQMT